MSIHPAKQALLAEISQSRAAVARDLRALKEELNVAAKLRASIRTHIPFWLGGATMAGFFFTRLFKRRKQAPLPPHPKSLSWGGIKWLSLLRMFLPLVKSAVAAYTTRKIYELARPIR